MSTICKLEIRGIRSFGIEKDDSQKLNFHSPLTLIVGDNGCGKTTIIECLKYALTGDVPPGSDRGKNFVHDPKIFNAVECLGQVKLMVKDYLGNKVTCTRSMKITQKKSNMKFETLDGTVHFETRDGKKSSISKRCADVNIEMCEAMGVSKAIINNVIFCHQEDSNWPLDEGKKLKEKFDAIFGTTEYNKVIEKLIKFGKGYSDKQKSKEGDLKLLEFLKKEAEVKTLEVSARETKLSKFKESQESYQSMMKPIIDNISKIDKVLNDIGKLQCQRIKINTNLKNCQEQQSQLRGKIKNLFGDSMIMLEREIRNFKQTMQSKKSKLSTLEQNLTTKKRLEKSIQEKIQGFESERGRLISQRQTEQDFISDRLHKIRTLCRKLNILVDDEIEISDTRVDSALIEIKAALKKEEALIRDMAKAHEDSDSKQQVTIDNLRETKAALESDQSSKSNQIKELTREKNRAQLEITNTEKSAQALKSLVEEIEKIDKEFESQSKNVNIENMRKELTDKKEHRDQLQERLDKIDEQIMFLSSISTLSTELEIKEKQYQAREGEFKRVRNKNSDHLKRLFPGQKIENNYKRHVQGLYEKLQKDINNLNGSINKSQAVVIEMQAMRKNHKLQLEKCEKELSENEERVYNECQGNAYEDVLLKLKEKIAKNQLDHGAYKSAELLYTKYISKISDEQCCPVCHKDMITTEISDIGAELSEEIRRLPDKIEAIEHFLKTDQTKYDKLLSLKPYNERIAKQKVELPQLRATLKTVEEKLSNASSEVDEFRMALLEPNSNLQLVNSVLGDMTILDEATKDMAVTEKEIQQLKSKLPSASNSNPMSMDEAKIEKATLFSENKNVRKSIDTLQTNIDSKVEQLNNLRERRNQMKTQQIKLQENVQALSQMKAKLVEVSNKIENCSKEVKEIERKLVPMKSKLEAEIASKRTSKEQNRLQLNTTQSKLDNLKSMDNEIERLSKEIKKLSELNLVQEISRLKEEMQKVRIEKNKNAEELEANSKDLDDLNKEISNQIISERDLEDNMDLKKLINEAEVLQTELDGLMNDIGELDFEKLQKDKSDLKKKEEDLLAKKSQLTGQMSELGNQIRLLKEELAQPGYKNALKNYLKTSTEVLVLKKILSDLTKYRNALESALMKYHSEKMDQINRTIYSLWRDIYRGNDIDYIKIKTDNEQVASGKRRVYNYRVVEAKNDVEIDMRGRCSAGQKVLASLIIRMALAETFSNNCSVLALDEPTTNLDRDNIASLCESLRRIVTEREHGNFMLIVITHDREFVTALEKCETYYRVSRNDNGKSVIEETQL